MTVDISRYCRALTKERINDIIFDLKESYRMNDHWILWAFPQKKNEFYIDSIVKYYSIRDDQEVIYFLDDYELSDYYQEALFTLKERMDKDPSFNLLDFFDKDFIQFHNHICTFYTISKQYLDHDDTLFKFIEYFYNEVNKML